MNRNIILIGMPGSGKTTIGERLSLKMNRNFVDLDKYIEVKEGKSIKELFEKGENYFREVEEKYVEDLKKFSNCIIATGGGTVINPKNVAILAENGYLVYIKRDIEKIAQSEKINDRPLLNDNLGNLYKLYYERSGKYSELAHLTIDNNIEFDQDHDIMNKVMQQIIDGYNKKKVRLMVINGPNLNFLGIREVNIYGKADYRELEKNILNFAIKNDIDVVIKQSNIEGEIVNFIQSCYRNFDGIIINAGAYTHYSIAILDALRSVHVPAIEVHLTNIAKREEYRRKSIVAEACIGQISGFGISSYKYAMEDLARKIKTEY